MTLDFNNVPDDFPDDLRYAEADAPVPSWEQATRSVQAHDPYMTAALSRIVADTQDENQARAVWESWPDIYRRSTALLIDKIHVEGWLDFVGAIINVWDGGWFFYPRVTNEGFLSDLLDAKSALGGAYTRSELSNGVFAFLNSWNHKAWVESWMENDAGMAALHVGMFANGTAEVHLDAFNPLYTNGAPPADVIEIPLLGSFNHRLFQLHRRWEQSEYATVARRSANFYHMLRREIALSF